MMRYQRVSPDCLPLSSGRKPKLTCKEDECGENERSQNYNSLEGKALRFRSGTTPSNIYLDQNLSQFIVSECEKHNTQRNERYESSSPSRGGDVVLQWGQNKRSRGSRSESRLVTEESVQSRQVMKIHKRVVEKQSTMNQMAIMPPPPTTTSPYSRRAANLRPCTPVHEITGSFLNRNSEERSITGNGGSSSRFVSRSADKRSSLSPEKTDRMASCCSTVLGEKSNGSVAGANPMNHVEFSPATLEQEAAVGGGGDKVNPNLFVWPRIYISLSRKEKEDDFFAMKGTKLPQRPKKRAKNIDKALQYCFPGMWLSDLTRGRYEVREKKNVKKQKRRGLKGMESMDSDSEL